MVQDEAVERGYAGNPLLASTSASVFANSSHKSRSQQGLAYGIEPQLLRASHLSTVAVNQKKFSMQRLPPPGARAASQLLQFVGKDMNATSSNVYNRVGSGSTLLKSHQADRRYRSVASKNGKSALKINSGTSPKLKERKSPPTEVLLDTP